MGAADTTSQAERVRLLEADPELAALVPAEERALAMRHAVGTSEGIAPGPWTPGELAESSRFGGVVTHGLLAREVELGSSASVELLGEGDILVVAAAAEGFIAVEAAWTALEPTRIAWLGSRFVPVVARWPQLSAELLARAERRTARLAIMQAIAQLVRVDDRVLALLWHLSERWGRVTSQGVVLPLRLTHRVIARLVGARRPSVTTAITSLERRGLVGRRDDGAWMLSGSPPEHVATAVPGPWRDGRTGGSSVTRVPDHAVTLVPATAPYVIRRDVAGLSEAYAAQAARTARAVRHAQRLRERSRELIGERMADRAAFARRGR